MIDLKANLEAIENMMKLMDKYQVDEIHCDFLMLKRSARVVKAANVSEVDEAELLQKHLQPSSTEPWENISQSDLDAWSQRGIK